jgi:hypothetical protein
MDTSTLPVVEGAKFSEPRALRFANGFTMAAAFVAWAGLSTSAAAQTHTWTLRDEIPARVRSAAAYDPARGRVVLMGGIGDGPMIEWDGVDWEIVPVAVPPLSQVGNSVAYDEARGQSVFMTNGSMLLWDGHALQTYAGALPTAVTDAAMAYDPVRQRVVLFGGGNAVTYFNETWEWDGVSWSRRLPANSPPARVRLAMSWDPVRQEVMVYGGEDRLGQLLSDQWFWNGTNWTQVVTSPRPPANRTRAMAADLARQRVVLCAGTAPGLDTWEWNGSAWSLVVTANRPRADRDVSCVYAGMNGKVMLAFGTASYVATETWLYDGVDWALADARPHSNGLLRTVADTARGCVVSYDSGFYMPWRTFEWNGVHWHARPTAHQPDAASAFDVAYDPVRQRVLLFGGEVLLAGSQPGPVLDALWAYDGVDWSRIQNSGTWPAARWQHRLAYDAAHDRVVMFGGLLGGAVTSETWLWDGTTWQQALPTASPPARRLHTMAYDEGRQRTVIYGGLGPSALTDTWEWDGANWASVPTPGLATSYLFPTSTYDRQSGRVVLVADTQAWSFDGTSWTSAGQLPARADAVAFDARTGALVARGDSLTAIGRFGVAAAAAVQSYGAGCPGTLGEPHLTARGQPHPGHPRFGLEVSRARPSTVGAMLLGNQVASVPIGACTLLVDPVLDSWLVFTDTSGFSESRVAIPPSSQLLGVVATVQCVLLDPAGFALGAYAGTAGLRLVIGD